MDNFGSSFSATLGKIAARLVVLAVVVGVLWLVLK